MPTLSKNGKPLGRPKKPKPTEVHTQLTLTHRHLQDSPLQIHAPTVYESEEWQALAHDEQAFLESYFRNGFKGEKAFEETWPNSPNRTVPIKAAVVESILNQPRILKALKLLTEYHMQERKITYAPRILEVLEAQAFYDPFDIINSEGELRVSLDELPHHLRVCVVGVETKWFGKDAHRSQTVVKLVDRGQALDKLARYIALLANDKPAITVNQQNNIIQAGTGLPVEAHARLAAIFDNFRPGTAAAVAHKKAQSGEVIQVSKGPAKGRGRA